MVFLLCLFCDSDQVVRRFINVRTAGEFYRIAKVILEIEMHFS
jgi:hypothetical protein